VRAALLNLESISGTVKVAQSNIELGEERLLSAQTVSVPLFYRHVEVVAITGSGG